MKSLKKLFDTTTKKIVALALVLIFIGLAVWIYIDQETGLHALRIALWTLLFVAVAWLAIHFGTKAWRKRKRKDFDEQVAAKEGIEDRRREWANWTEELEKQGIDRYELPFYLLVGEPQSGKSVLLHNSDLHFPFGQSRLSGVGGTRGCDWWFTEEAVILDLAGRLFTHEGGAADRLEFEAFLDLLFEFRPLCPVNGVMLVIPCDSLLKDTPELCAAKATKIQAALHTLTTKLQAQLPVYLVLTKGDQVFGFAESVHRLDVDRRHQMFGWSRPPERSEAPFDLEEVRRGFRATVERASLLRSHSLAGARLPEALPEIDRMYAFPPELEGLYPNLEVYLKRIFTSSNVVDRVFFRGLYLTSGLQTGVPIAKVCSDLFGQSGEADGRDLEALFSKQRAYFIKDLVRDRIFGERGLVRPTQGRVQQARRVALAGYGFAAALVLGSALFGANYMRGLNEKAKEGATGEGEGYIAPEDRVAIDEIERVVQDKDAPISDVLHALDLTVQAIDRPRGAYEEWGRTTRATLKELYSELFDVRVIPQVRREAQASLVKLLDDGPRNHADLQRLVNGALQLSGEVDFAESAIFGIGKSPRELVLECLPAYADGGQSGAGLSLAKSFELRAQYGDKALMRSPPPSGEDGDVLTRLLSSASSAFERCLEPGSVVQPEGEVGYVLAWMGAVNARAELRSTSGLGNAGIKVFTTCKTYMRCVERLQELQPRLAGKIQFGKLVQQMIDLGDQYAKLHATLAPRQGSAADVPVWDAHLRLKIFSWEKIGQQSKTQNQVTDWWRNPLPGDFGQDAWAYLGDFASVFGGEAELAGDSDAWTKFGVDEGDLLTLCRFSLRPDPSQPTLRGLATRLKDLNDKVVGGFPSDYMPLFLAQTQAEALSFDELESPDELWAAFGEAQPSQTSGSFSSEMVDELARLHEEVGTVRGRRQLPKLAEERMRTWQGRIERLLYGYLDELRRSGQASAWVAPIATNSALSPDGWTQLDALGRATTLKQVDQSFPVVSTSSQVLVDAFLASGDALFVRWQERESQLTPQEAGKLLSGIVQSTTELRQVAVDVSTRPAIQAALEGSGEGSTFDNWRLKVDEHFDALLGRAEKASREVWEAKPPVDFNLQQVAAFVEEALQPSELQRRFTKATEADLGRIDELLKLAPTKTGAEWGWIRLQKSTLRAEGLRPWVNPPSAANVGSSPELAALVRALERVGGLSTAQGPDLAQAYSTFFAAPAPSQAAPNAGVGLVRQLRESVRAQLLKELRASYLRALEELLTNSRQEALRQALSWKPGEVGTFDQDDNVVKELDGLLREHGLFQELREQYLLINSDPTLEPLLFEAVSIEGACQPAASLHHFLLSLQKFLLGEGSQRIKSVRDAKLKFYLLPVTEEYPGSVWFPEDKDAVRDYFYYPEERSGSGLRSWPIARERKKLTVDLWGFESSDRNRQLTLLWSKFGREEKALGDEGSYRFDVPSSLAPLLLAWQGQASEDCQSFRLDLKPSHTKLTAQLLLQFDVAVPLPPSKWPW